MLKKSFVAFQRFVHFLLITLVLRFLPDEYFIKIEYFFLNRRFPNLNSPQKFTEKVLWLMLYGNLKAYARFVDKYEVRDFVARVAGEKYLIPIYGIWDSFEEIPFDALPEKFVLKATHSSHSVLVCKDKASLNSASLKRTVNRWLKEDYSRKFREPQYIDCSHRIICEEYKEDESGGLIDYKFHCFHGEPILIEVISNRHSNEGMNVEVFDLKWRRLAIKYRGYSIPDTSVSQPICLQEMIHVAEKLSKDFAFVRVDLYCVDNKVFFGELTFTPSNGMDVFEPEKYDFELGKRLNLVREMMKYKSK